MQRLAGLRGHPLAGMTNAGAATSFALRTLHSLRSLRLSLCLGIAPPWRICRGVVEGVNPFPLLVDRHVRVDDGDRLLLDCSGRGLRDGYG